MRSNEIVSDQASMDVRRYHIDRINFMLLSLNYPSINANQYLHCILWKIGFNCIERKRAGGICCLHVVAGVNRRALIEIQFRETR